MHSPRVAEDNRLLRSIPAERVALIERIRRAAPGLGRRNELRQRFLRAYFHGVAALSKGSLSAAEFPIVH